MAELTTGDAAPDFDAVDQDGKRWRLSDLRGRKVVLYFYPADDTPGCTMEACDFRDNHEAFEKTGYVVLGVSSQGSDSHRAFREKYGLNFPLLVDEDLTLAEAYGARSPETMFFNDIPLDVTRSTFVIDENGVIEQALYGVKSRGHVGELRETLSV